jgi:hypothetical protein
MSGNPYARQSQMWPLAESVRAYVAAVDRTTGSSVPFDPSAQGEFDLDLPPEPFLDLGWVENFRRVSETKHEVLRTGPDGCVAAQYTEQLDAAVEFDLPNWGKLQMAVAGGGQQINVLATSIESDIRASGGTPIPAVYLQGEPTMVVLPLAPDALTKFRVGDMVAVDWDYQGQVGYVGSGITGTCLTSTLDAASHKDLIRRVTFNVSRVSYKTDTSLYLAQSLIGGAQIGMGVQKVVALLDREGGSYYQEWAVLFVIAGGTGGRTCFYYPRVQAAIGASEAQRTIEGPLFSDMLHARLRALPSVDPNDGEEVLCYRSYFPAKNAKV